jgi:hypothetical protein
MHFLENAHALLVPIIHLSQQREIISGVLIENIIFDDDHLQFFHIESCVHLNGALVNQVNNGALLLKLLATVRQVDSLGILDNSVRHLFGLSFLLFFVFIQDGLEDFLSLLLALIE